VILVNHFTGPDRAVLVTDTLTVRKARPAAFGPKFLPVPHAAMILTGRGPNDVLWAAFRELQHTFYRAGIDGAEAVLPSLLTWADADLRTAYPDVEGLATEVVALGYSPRAGAYRAFHFRSVADFAPDPPGGHLPVAGTAGLPTGPPRGADKRHLNSRRHRTAARLGQRERRAGRMVLGQRRPSPS
jgi:hypothetical protein